MYRVCKHNAHCENGKKSSNTWAVGSSLLCLACVLVSLPFIWDILITTPELKPSIRALLIHVNKIFAVLSTKGKCEGALGPRAPHLSISENAWAACRTAGGTRRPPSRPPLSRWLDCRAGGPPSFFSFFSFPLWPFTSIAVTGVNHYIRTNNRQRDDPTPRGMGSVNIWIGTWLCPFNDATKMSYNFCPWESFHL